MFVTGPWNLGEFSRRLPPELADAWATAPLPGPDAATPGVSLAGGSSLVIFRRSEHKDAAWRLIEFLSAPAQQERFSALTGDLPARVEAWEDSALAAVAARARLPRAAHARRATPKIPEWEQIAMRVQEQAEFAVRGAVAAGYGARAPRCARWTGFSRNAAGSSRAPPGWPRRMSAAVERRKALSGVDLPRAGAGAYRRSSSSSRWSRGCS